MYNINIKFRDESTQALVVNDWRVVGNALILFTSDKEIQHNTMFPLDLILAMNCVYDPAPVF